jgi:pimeloyl-ACP methyl ester carboxylesterase
LTEIIPIPAAARVQGAEEHQVTIDNVAWRYLRCGSGPPLVLLHGLMGYSWSWRFNMQELGEYFTVYAPDLPGCGFSQRADCLTGSLESDAEALLKFLDHLGITKFNLLGTSRGGGVSLVLAGLLAQRDRLDRLPRLILSAPVNPWSKFGQARVRVLAKGPGRLWTLYIAKHMPFLLQHYFRRLYADVSRIAPGSVEGYEAGLEPPRSFHHLVGIMREWFAGLKQIEEALPSLQELPILLLWGDRDRAVYPSSAQELHRRLRNSTVLTMEGVGHLPYEETPTEFNRIVFDFFLRNTPPTLLDLLSASCAEEPAVGSSTEHEPSQLDVTR